MVKHEIPCLGDARFTEQCLSLVGCLKPVPTVPIPGSDASPPTLVWETYNLGTKETREIAQDGQTLDVPSNEQVFVTIAVEDLQSGVKDVSLAEEGQYACKLGDHTEKKAEKLEQQHTTRIPDHENKVPVSASLSYTVEFAKMGSKKGGALCWWEPHVDRKGA